MLRTLIVLVLLSQSAAALDYFRLASWNIENLGGRTPGQRPIAIAEHILLVSPDILVTQREEVAEVLVDQMDEVDDNFDDQDIVIIGDTNILGDDEEAVELFVEAGYRDLNSADRPTFVTGDAPFDRVFVPLQDEFRFSRQYVLVSADGQSHDQFLSDHYMVVTVIKVLDDDD